MRKIVAPLCLVLALLALFVLGTQPSSYPHYVNGAAHAQGGPIMPGPGFGYTSAPSLSVTYVGYNYVTTGTTTAIEVCASGCSTGGAYLCAFSAGTGGSGTISVSSATINGTSATKVVAEENADGPDVELWIATGVTASGTVTCTATWSTAPTYISSYSVAAAGWLLSNLNSATATATAEGTTSGSAITLSSISAGGAAFGAMTCNTSTSATWSGLTADFFDGSGQTGYPLAAAHSTFGSAQSSYNVTTTSGCSASFANIAASFR